MKHSDVRYSDEHRGGFFCERIVFNIRLRLMSTVDLGYWSGEPFSAGCVVQAVVAEKKCKWFYLRSSTSLFPSSLCHLFVLFYILVSPVR